MKQGGRSPGCTGSLLWVELAFVIKINLRIKTGKTKPYKNKSLNDKSNFSQFQNVMRYCSVFLGSWEPHLSMLHSTAVRHSWILCGPQMNEPTPNSIFSLPHDIKITDKLENILNDLRWCLIPNISFTLLHFTALLEIKILSGSIWNPRVKFRT